MRKILVVLLIFIWGNSLFAQDWWNEKWQFRKKVKVVEKKKSFPQEKVVILHFTGKAEENGQDIRVIDENGQKIPYFLVATGPGAKYQISFPAEGNRYFIYYGNKNAEKVFYDWRPEAGLLLEVYERKGSACSNWEVAKKTIEESKKGRLIGRSFWGRIWDGTNPLGAEKDVVKIYTGYFHCRKDDEYFFATSSAGASFLFIDGNLVASWPGWHRAEPFVRPEHSGSIHLETGIHKLTYYHLGRKWQEISVAAIKLFDKERFVVIPGKFFIPASEAEIIKTEKFGKKLAANFEWKNTNYLRREKWELLTFNFIDTSFSDAEIVEWKWDFGDGQESTIRNPGHTYLLPGFYTISLSIRNKKGETDTVSMKVKVKQDYSKMRLYPKKYREYLKEFSKFNLGDLGNEELLILAQIFLSYDHLDDAYRCYKNLQERNLRDKTKTSLVSADLAVKVGKYEEAEEIYREILRVSYLPETALKLGKVCLEMEKLDAAQKEFEKVKADKKASDKIKRKAKIGIGDICRIRGSRDEAEKIYEKLTDKELLELKNGSYAQSVLYYLKRKDFFTALEQLDLWGEEIPLSKLRGDWSILKARAYILKKDYKRALKELEIFQKICKEKENPYLPLAIRQAEELISQPSGKLSP